jgi:toxin YoeB
VNLTFTARAWKHYLYWQDNDRRTLAKVNDLIRDCLRTPTEGLGQPEALRAELSGFWSRRIDHKNRLVYAITDTHIEIVQCRYHYDDR